MTSLRLRQVATTSLAMFSMFFGAGNIVFPLTVAQKASNMVGVALIGLIIADVLLPFIGLYAMILFEGDYKTFFNRTGRLPGYLIALVIISLLGPLNVVPRCIALSYSTMHLYCPGMSELGFSVIACIAVFIATVRKSKIVDLLGKILSPLLIIFLTVIIVAGFWSHEPAPVIIASTKDIFVYGLHEGYNMMDLLAGFFFSSIAIASLRKHIPKKSDSKLVARLALQSSLVAAILLGIIYAGFAYVASYNSAVLAGLSSELLLGTLANAVLGSSGGFVVSVAVTLACLTTAVTLTALFAEFLQEQNGFQKLGYRHCLLVTLVTSCALANIGFSGIVEWLQPLLVIFYPALIVLVLCNILYKKRGIHVVKAPVFLTAFASFVHYNWAWFAPLLGA